MLQNFRIPISDTPLFCKACQGVFLHSLRARQPLHPGIPADSKEPILISCHHCRQSQIFVAGEFRDFSPPPKEGELSKIAGKSRLQVKDTVYIPGSSCVGVVKSRFRAGNQEQYVITQATGEDVRWPAPPHQHFGENAQEGFRLLPAAIGDARIGDSVYHVARERFGLVVGILFSRESKLVVQFEDNSLLLTTLPDFRQIPENRSLGSLALEQAHQRFPQVCEGLHIEAGQGILYARGTCASLGEAMEIRKLLREIPSARGAVDILSVRPTITISDEALCEHAMEALLHPEFSLFGIQVHCQDGEATITGFCRNEAARQEAAPLLEAIPGLRGLALDLRLRPHEEPGEREKAQTVAQALRRNATLREAKIRIFSLDGALILEGSVSSSLQRNAAALAAMWAGRNFKVDNRLRIAKAPQRNKTQAFIKVA